MASAATSRKPPSAPPVYRPQPAPKVLQRKTVVVPSRPPVSRPSPTAPPAYRPNPSPKVLQTKMSPAQIATAPLVRSAAASVVQRQCAHDGQAHSPCVPRSAILQPVRGTIQLSKDGKKDKKKVIPKAERTTKGGKLTKQAQQKREEKEQREAEKARKEKEVADRREWDAKARLGEKKGAAQEWETNPDFFNRWAHGASTRPPNTEAPVYPIPILDLGAIRNSNPYLAQLIRDSIMTIRVRPETPEHGNRERRLPTYDATVLCPYWEFSFLGGGGRMVVDAVAGMVYICQHYTYYYEFRDGGAIPQHPVNAANQRRDEIVRLNLLYGEALDGEAAATALTPPAAPAPAAALPPPPAPSLTATAIAAAATVATPFAPPPPPSMTAHMYDDDDEEDEIVTPLKPPSSPPFYPGQ